MDFVFASQVRNIKNINVAFQNIKPIPKGVYTLKLAALNVYRVFINDVFFHYGPSRSAHGYLQQDELQLHLTGEVNYITVEVVGNNVNNYYIADELPTFAAELYQRNQLLLKTDSFECFLLNDRTIKIQRYSFQRAFAESYDMTLDRSSFYLGDRSMFPKISVEKVTPPFVQKRLVPYPMWHVSNQLPKVENGTFSIDSSRPVWNDRAIDQISETYQGYYRHELEVKLSDEVSQSVFEKSVLNNEKLIQPFCYHIYDTKRTLTGFLNLKVTVIEPVVFYVMFDETDFHESQQKNTDGIFVSFSRNDCSNILRYALMPGTYNLIAFEPYSMRYINIMVRSGSMRINEVNFIKYENHEMYRLQVKTNDDDINLIIKAAQNTLAQNAVDVLTDCPSRERAGWLCDSWFSARSEQLMSGDNKIEHNFLLNYALSPQSEYLPKGMIPMNYPADHTDGIFIPNWSLWYGIELYDYYLRTSDDVLIKHSKGKIEGLITYFKRFENEYGLLENLESWVFVEWSKANDFVAGVNIPSNMIYAHFLACVGKLYGNHEWLIKAEKIKETIKKLSYQGDFFVDQLLRDENQNLIPTQHISETCQYYAFFTDVSNPKDDAKLYQLLMNEFGPNRDDAKVYPKVYKSNAFIGNYLRLEILRRNEAYHQVIQECKAYFLYMAKRTETLWEHRFVFASLNHGFASYAANLIVEALTGIKAYNRKKNAIQYKKIMSDLDFSIFIPYGEGIRINKEKNQIDLQLPSSMAIETI